MIFNVGAGGATDADKIKYDNSKSGLNATDVNSAVDELASEKVDKVSGMGLSQNSYTTTEKNKLSGIATGATKNVVDSSLSTSSTNAIQNKVVATSINTINSNINKINSNINTINESLGGFAFQTVDGEKQVSVDGGLTWENFSNAPSHILFSMAGNNFYQSSYAYMTYIENGAVSFHKCKNNNIYTFDDISLKVYVTSANASCYYEIINNGSNVVSAYNTYESNQPKHTINPSETLKILGMNSSSSCVIVW